ncbi:RsfA family transcriptional regulator [Bacillus lacus]|uniref:RsfA family transcriptional regulator n=1 Tax=Metabacillus lacus TaxID=1983721 RepID=A0A7X2IX80_9BACI|nr:RsfA family transcriptional regulator [Metabacillus lacus]MRX71127.1 RsfA family transcriptional regulator [Metabacillus lacus]
MKQRQDAWSEENDLLLAETVLRHVREGSTQLNAFEEVGDKLNRTSAACGFRWNAVVRHNYEKALQLAKKQRKQKMRSMGKGQPAKKQLLYTPPENQTSMPAAEEVDMMPFYENDKAPEPLYLEEFSEEQEEMDFGMIQNQMPYYSSSPPSAPAAQELTLDDVVDFLQSYRGDTVQLQALQHENERLKRENGDLLRMNHDLQKQVARLEQDTSSAQEDYDTLMKIMNRARKLVLFEEEERPSTKFKMDRNGNLEKLAE